MSNSISKKIELLLLTNWHYCNCPFSAMLTCRETTMVSYRAWSVTINYLLFIICTIIAGGILYGIVTVLKLVRKRSYFNSHLPGWKLRPSDVWGDFKNTATGDQNYVPESAKVFQMFGAYTKLFRDRKCFAYWFNYNLIVAVVTAESVEEVLTGNSFAHKRWFYDMFRPWLGDGLLLSDGRKWKTRRKMFTPAFHFDILKDFLPIMNKKTQILVKILEKETNRPWTNINKLFALCTLDIICETTLGVHIGAQENNDSEYVQAVNRSTTTIVERSITPLYWFDFAFYLSKKGWQFKADMKLLHEFTRKIIQERKKELTQVSDISRNKKRKPLMELLLEQHIQDNSITEDDIIEEVNTFAFAGRDTTATAMSWTLYLIGLYKDVQEKLREELDLVFGNDRERPVTVEELRDLKYLERVLKESQRLYPSIPLFVRDVKEDATLCGYKIPKGASISILPFYIHRDESVFPDPEKFDPDRFLPENSVNRHPYAYIPFSAGPRNCIGQRLALMEEKVAIANVLRNYIVESLEPRDKIIVLPAVTLKSVHPLKVKFLQR